MPETPEVLCVGELLWDSLPAGLFLGGAPFNVAAHLAALGQPAALVSRVGADRLGREAARRAAGLGVGCDLLQHDDTLPTGFVEVHLDGAGSATYDIVAPAAWDALEATDAAVARAAAARAVVFGSLGQRTPAARDAIQRLTAAAAMSVFDVNLRPPFDEAEVVTESLKRAQVVKLNEAELTQIGRWLGVPDLPTPRAGEAIARRFDVRVLCVTRGAHGAAMLREGRWSEHPGFPVEVVDTVGAGDAFLAALLRGLLADEGDDTVLQAANSLGAFVASRHGAVPRQEAVGTAACEG